MTPIEDQLSTLLAAWLNTNRPTGFPPKMPILIANRDEIRTRPCVVINTSDTVTMSAMPSTARIKLDFHIFTQSDDTPAATHAKLAGALACSLITAPAGVSNSTFKLHALIPKDSGTTPDETRGRETIISFEAVAAVIS